MMQHILKKVCLTVVLAALTLPLAQAQGKDLWEEGTHAQSSGGSAPGGIYPDRAPTDSQQTTYHWKKARAYQQEQRYELARQHYLLSLSACRSEETRDQLQRDLQIIDLQLRTLR